ncbi:uncharacterized protein L969DRAFT_89588 [Mixia osmundae IAM 14324]|uniref:Pre-mRNA-splicing factor SPF27 n=1 Tax=Mixia osmundae (strain CBS 9802 / IAM 14324 / JCM 22182 / KY 12970) TaxID=764103 RepID=G7EA75_MIXOS|nr:uncharacterized protein L969DRAFT_89588 [Mixia osmundae IAM 14324]KEI37633.1 hypothetical protein L969DRAFT_89588 [Mixia osmundae IAM 14324]GAA99735.1 hypothetical protein E5Q_06438 [Mixia osmundae IAM 14324]
MDASMIDSLPYIDKDYDDRPEAREVIEKELAKELARLPKRDLSSQLPEDVASRLFSSSHFLQTELKRVSSSSQAEGGLDTTRYSLPVPPSGEQASIEEWQAALDNASAQLEHQATRLNNLELLNSFGANSWRLSNFLIDRSAERYKGAIDSTTEATETINRQRKSKQLAAGAQLEALEQQWSQLISANLQIEIANLSVEQSLDALRQREQELQRKLEETA